MQKMTNTKHRNRTLLLLDYITTRGVGYSYGCEGMIRYSIKMQPSTVEIYNAYVTKSTQCHTHNYSHEQNVNMKSMHQKL